MTDIKTYLETISIHAPAKGATDLGRHYSGDHKDFNPRSREGSDVDSGWHAIRQKRFQSTLPRRERQHLLTSFRLQYGYFYFISTIKYSSCFKKIN